MNYLRIYDEICSRAEKVEKRSECSQRDVCARAAVGKWCDACRSSHLIIPSGIWGSTSTPDNVVYLTNRERIVAYALLRKIYPYSKHIALAYHALIKARGKKRRKIPYRRKPHSEATRAKMSASHTGKTFSAESRQRMSESKRGVKFTAEHIAARSESRKRNARGFSAESRERMRLAALNRKVKPKESKWSTMK